MNTKNPLIKTYFSFKVAFRGFWWAMSERHMRFHVGAAVLAVAAGLWLSISTLEWLAVLIVIGMVLSAELCNTSLEEIADLATHSHQWSYGTTTRLRDISAAAVLVNAIIAAVVGTIIFLPKLLALG